MFFLPDQFQSSARVYVDTQSVLKPLLTGLAVQPNIEQQVEIMSRTLISRPNLEKILRMSDMDIKLKTPEEKENALDKLGKDIQLSSAGRDNLYSISYTNAQPEDAKRVVQSLLTIFVEGSLGDKRKDADSARRFIDEQLKSYEQKLIAAENALKEFKRQNIGMMPEDGSDYYKRIAQAGAALNEAQLELREAENSRDALRRQIEGEEPVMLAEEIDVGARNPELEGRLNSLRARLDDQLLRYTAVHPDVMATKKLIEQYEAQQREEAKKRPNTPRMMQQNNPVVQQLAVSLAEAEARVAALKARTQGMDGRFTDLKTKANAVPQVEADMAQLNRDYEVNKKNYETLLARRESANISGEMEANTSVMDFRIVDPPRVPLHPNGPNRPLLASIVLIAALAGGIGIAVIISLLRPVFNDRRTVRDVSNLPLLGSVTMIWTPSQVRKRKQRMLAFFATLTTLLGAYAGIVGFLLVQARLGAS